LEWLCLNHIDYVNVSISDEHLEQYTDNEPPVCVAYKNMVTNKTPEGMSLFDADDEDGTSDGECPFTVHGLTGEELNTMSTYAIKARALQHLNNFGKVLAIGHAETPESIRNRLLMYHDKRFQTDSTFPFVAFSHEQIKTTTSQSFLLADKHIFNDISERLLSLNTNSINSLIECLANDDYGKPETEEEKNCYQIIKDLDHIQGQVKGSITSKKWMKNEIWSLINHCGAPFWYITLSPADLKHPICLYYAGNKETFHPDLAAYEHRLRLICQNPVAGARFFHFVVSIFIQHVLGLSGKHRGLYGKTRAYYGTVEQQGRLTLHLHILLWLIGNLTSQEMRNQILDVNSDFQKKIIAWIESCQVGEFLTGTHQEVMNKVHKREIVMDYKNPPETMPIPPSMCKMQHKKGENCVTCDNLDKWWDNFAETVDDLICKSNVHDCERGSNKDGSRKKNLPYVGCKDNKYGKCRARFPRPTFMNSYVDPDTGSINLKKKEEWINTLTPQLTYLFCCNTDVTCMWSGTALKAVIMYITNYITKSGLKTHVIFDVIKSIFEKNHDIINGNISEKEKARKLISKIVNLLSTKIEMGAPMVCMYLLGNPDHYTSHSFIPFFWTNYVNEVYNTWNPDNKDIKPAKVTILKNGKQVIGLSPIDDYVYRPSEIEDMCLYDWVRYCKRKCLPASLKAFDKEKNSDSKDKSIRKSDILCSDSDSDSDNINDESPDYGDIKQAQQPLPKSMYRFLKAHPLYNSHSTILKQDNPYVVANFIGILPQSDKGDKEYYCLTMLVLFKPWHEGLKLKDSEASWDETFINHEFTERQLELMSNFNIRFECLDAHDDYNAQLKKNGAESFFPYGEQVDHDKNEDFDANMFTASKQNEDFETLKLAGKTELKH
jgi:hypothetical protein